jgi:predicted ATP-binding protein involved in virulence
MRLKKITLTNFRCFEKLELDLHPRLTVIVGENGAGKTAILDGIAAGLSPILRYLSSANQRLSAKGAGIKDTDFRLESWEGRGGKERWGAADFAQVACETTSGLQWDYWKPSAAGVPPPARRGESMLSSWLSEISDSLKGSQPKMLPVFAYYGAQRGRIEIPERLRASKENYEHPTSALVEALDSLSNFKEMLKWFDIEEAAELRANKGATNDEFSPSAALEAVREAIEILLGGAYYDPHFNRDHKFVVESVNGSAPLQVLQLSQGYQSMLALGMDFARRLALGNPHMTYLWPETLATAIDKLVDLEIPFPTMGENSRLPSSGPVIAPAIMLVDEIDLHLHPAWQQRVIGDLMRAFPGTQFILTTHSPQVLSTVRRENIRVISSDANGDIFAAPPLSMTYGEPSGDVMHSVMMVDPQPPVREKADLLRLTEWVDQGYYETPEALQLMQSLTNALGAQHPQLLKLQRSIQRQDALKR